MSLPISRYLAALTGLLAALVLMLDWRVGLAFCVAAAATVLPLYWLPVPKRYFYVPLFVAATLIVTTLARAPFLAAAPELFLYPRIGVVTPDVVTRALLKYAFYSGLLFFGLFAGFQAFGAGAADRRPFRDAPLFIRASAVIALVSLLVFAARVFLQFGMGLHTKSAMNPRFGFLSELVPDGLLYPICILFLAKYRRRVPPFETVVFFLIAAGMIGLTLLSGSRRSFATMGLALFIYFLAQKGDFRISLGRSLTIGVASVWLLLLTFAIAGPIRSSHRQQGGYGAHLGAEILRGAKTALQPEAAMFLGNAVSRRISLGMDGMVAVEMYRPKMAVDALSPLRTLERAAAKLIPRYSASGNSMSSGKALGVAYSFQSLDLKHASAFGLFASLDLTFGRWASFGAALVFGLLCAAYFGITARIAEPDVVYLLHFLGMQLTFGWIISGNLDGLIATTATNVIVLGAYSFGISMVIIAAGRSWDTGPRVEPA